MLQKIKDFLGLLSGYKTLNELLKIENTQLELESKENQEEITILRDELDIADIKFEEVKKQITELTKQLALPTPPTILGTIPYSELWKLLASLFPKDTGNIHLSDRNYPVCTIADIRRFVEWDTVDKEKYVKEVFDCDDYARALAGAFARYSGWSGFPVTDIWGNLYGGHAFVIVIAYPSAEDLTPTAYFIEPQTDVEIALELVKDMKLWVLPMTRR